MPRKKSSREIQKTDSKKVISSESEKPDDIAPDTLEGKLQSLDPSSLVRLIERVESFTGPIPPPEMLKEHEKILPDSANRII